MPCSVWLVGVLPPMLVSLSALSLLRMAGVVLAATATSICPAPHELAAVCGKIDRPHCAEPEYFMNRSLTAPTSADHFDMLEPAICSFMEPDSSTAIMM